MKYSFRFISLFCLLILSLGAGQVQDHIHALEDEAAIEASIESYLSRMTLDEKILFTTGNKEKLRYDGPPPLERLNIPPYVVAHGPYGARAFKYNEKLGRRQILAGTFMGASMNYASSWNPELVRAVGEGVGKEIRSMDNHGVAGPAFNIVRDLRCGRSAEYFTEDPFLNGSIAAPFVQGLQSERVMVFLKHFAANNQETSRGSLDVNVSHRALHEIYFPGFEAAVVEGKAMGVMSAYNKVNGLYCAENPYLLTDTLRNRWGFNGFVLSDWSGTHSTVPMLNAGLDLEMPRPRWYGKKLKAAIEKKEASIEVLDERVRNILRVLHYAKVLGEDYQNPPESVFKSKEMKAHARTLAEESMILLKNDRKVLPFDAKKIKKIAVIGPHSEYGRHFRGGKYDYMLFQVGGSANVKPEKEDMITPLVGIKKHLAAQAKVVYSPGCYAENGCGPIPSAYFKTPTGKEGLEATYFEDTTFSTVRRVVDEKTISHQWDKDPLVPEATLKVGSEKKFSARWKGEIMIPETRTYLFELRYEGEAKITIGDQVIYTGEGVAHGGTWWQQFKVDLKTGHYDFEVEYVKNKGKAKMMLWWDYENLEWMERAVELAKHADAVVLNVGNSGEMEREGHDRFHGLRLSEAQETLIKKVAAVNSNTAVVAFTSGIIKEEWKNDVPAIIGANYPGEQAGHAIADVLFGDVNPSGKLTVTIPKSLEQYPAWNWEEHEKSITYKEGVFVGYRWFEKNGLEPAFPFGHGLSYTSFDLSNLQLSHNKIDSQVGAVMEVDVTNRGEREGAEVVQLYISELNPAVERPVKELKGFQKINLLPGQSKKVRLPLAFRSFATFDEASEGWVVNPGKYELMLGTSSKDIRQRIVVDVL